MRALLLAALLALGGRGHAADEAKVLRLLNKINLIPYVDTHIHLAFPSPGSRDPYDVSYLLGAATYVAEFTYGNTWEETKKSLAVNAHHAYYRPILEAMRDLYGLGKDEELSDSNHARISKAMTEAHKQPGWHEKVFDKANVAHLIDLDAGDKGQAEMPGPRWHSLWNIDGLVYISGQEKKSKAWAIDGIQKKYGIRLKSLADHEKLLSDKIEDYFKRGGAGLKSTSAYFRKLDFELGVRRDYAAQAYAKVLKHGHLSDRENKALQDHLMLQILGVLHRLKKPIQFHTGNQQNWNVVENSNPLGLNNLFFDGRFTDARFVLLHGGYPYSSEAITLARYYSPTVSLDLAWMALFSPTAAKQALGEAIDMLNGTQLMFGTDSANLEEMYGTIKFTRRILAEVLAEKIQSGYLTEAVALQIAHRVLYQNAVDLYQLGKPQ